MSGVNEKMKCHKVIMYKGVDVGDKVCKMMADLEISPQSKQNKLIGILQTYDKEVKIETLIYHTKNGKHIKVYLDWLTFQQELLN